MHFEIRRGGHDQYQCINPWSELPYPDTPGNHTVEVVGAVAWGGGNSSLPGVHNMTVQAAALATELDLAGMSIVALVRVCVCVCVCVCLPLCVCTT